MALAAASAAVLAVIALYALRLNHAAGLMVDDAWYVLLAKSLAEGSGYRLISSAATPILPNYPPGFPAVLSLVFRVSSEFPQNVWLLKSVSIAAMMGVGLLSYAYLRHHRHLSRDVAACVAVAVMMTPAFVFLATSTVMSECVFTLTQLATVLLIHRSVETTDRRTGRSFVVLAAILAAATVLIRSAAAGLVIAAVLWFVKERLGKRAVVFAAVVVLCLLPWWLYARAHMPTAAERAAHGGAVVYGYTDQFWMRWAGTPELGRITLRDLPARIEINLVDVFGRDVGGILMPTLFRGASESGEEVVALGGAAGLSTASMGGAVATLAISLFLSSIAFLGFVRTARERLTVAELLVPIALAIVVVWPFWSFRFVLPLAPYLFLYFVVGVQTLALWSIRRSTKAEPYDRLTRRATIDPWRVPRIAMLCIIGLNVYDHVGYILLARDPIRSDTVDWIADSHEVDAVLDWMSGSLGKEGVIATTNPALVYLRTGRKAIAFDDPTTDLRSWKKRGVRYVAGLFPVELPAGSPGEHKVLYRSPRRLWVIDIWDPKLSEPAFH